MLYFPSSGTLGSTITKISGIELLQLLFQDVVGSIHTPVLS